MQNSILISTKPNPYQRYRKPKSNLVFVLHKTRKRSWWTRVLCALGLCLALMLGPGCATTVARLGSEDGAYPATHLDFYMWAFACLPDSGKGQISMEVDYNHPGQWFIRPVFTAFLLIDLVPSLATDTLMLPYDLVKE